MTSLNLNDLTEGEQYVYINRDGEHVTTLTPASIYEFDNPQEFKGYALSASTRVFRVRVEEVK